MTCKPFMFHFICKPLLWILWTLNFVIVGILSTFFLSIILYACKAGEFISKSTLLLPLSIIFLIIIFLMVTMAILARTINRNYL